MYMLIANKQTMDLYKEILEVDPVPIDVDALNKYMEEKAIDMANKWADKVMKSEPKSNQIPWKDTPIPESWYKILTEYTAKYALKIDILEDPTSLSYTFMINAGPYYGFSIGKAYTAETYGYKVLETHLAEAVKSMGLEAPQKWTDPYQKVQIGFTGVTTSQYAPLPDVAAPKAGLVNVGSGSPKLNWGKLSGKLNSLYEMYGMVDPKPIRYCKKHRPTVSQFLAKMEAAEKEAEAAKTIKDMSPALTEAFISTAEKYLTASNPFYKMLKKKGNFGGEYYTNYGKQMAAQQSNKLYGLGTAGAGAISQETYLKAQGYPSNKSPICDFDDHVWIELPNGHEECSTCNAAKPGCKGCNKQAAEPLVTAKQAKKLKKKAAKLAAMLKAANDISEPPEDLF